MATPNEQKINALTAEQLVAIIQELRKPVKTEREIALEQQQQADRERMMETLKQTEENRVARIKNCSHMRNNGSTPAVWIADLGKLYCQHCGGWISPSENPETFNKLYQLATGTDGF